MRNCNFLVKEAGAVKRALVSQAWADYRLGIDSLEDCILDIQEIKKADHKSRVNMLRQRGIAYTAINYRGVNYEN